MSRSCTISSGATGFAACTELEVFTEEEGLILVTESHYVATYAEAAKIQDEFYGESRTVLGVVK